MEDCKRISYESSNDEKFYIAEITGTKVEKNDTRFYKVRWEQTWIPASRLGAWQALIIKFWEGFHRNNDAKVMEIEGDCEQSPPVFVLPPDCDTRDERQASTNSDKMHVLETEHDMSSNEGSSDPERNDEKQQDEVNIVNGVRNEEMSRHHDDLPRHHDELPRHHDELPRHHNEVTRHLENLPKHYNVDDRRDDLRHEEIALYNDKISILGYKSRYKRMPPFQKDDLNDHMRNEPMPPERMEHPSIKDEPMYTYPLYNNQMRSYLPPHEKNMMPPEPYNNYRHSLSPTSLRDPHDFATLPSTRNSLSPQGQMVPYELSQRKKPYNCDICGKEYRSLTGLKQHLLAHKNEKPYGCKLCHRRYRWKGDLNRHWYTHLPNEEQPLKCPVCQKGFVRKDKMQLHVNFAHGGGNGTTTTTTTTTTTINSEEEKESSTLDCTTEPENNNTVEISVASAQCNASC